MSPILTLQEIPDIDTLTLEEKLEEIQLLPNAEESVNLIAVIRIELHERHRVEEFGRMLINDEIPIITELDIGLPLIKAKQVNKPTQIRYRKQQIADFLKKSLVPSSQILIGKPTLDYRYKPTLDYRSKPNPKTTSRHRKSSIIKNTNINPKTTSVHSSAKTSIMLQKQYNAKSSSHVKLQTSKWPTANNQNKREYPGKQLDQQPKRQNEFTIRFIENDVYDEKKLKQEQNLAEVEKEIADTRLEAQDSEIEEILQVPAQEQNQQGIAEEDILEGDEFKKSEFSIESNISDLESELPNKPELNIPNTTKASIIDKFQEDIDESLRHIPEQLQQSSVAPAIMQCSLTTNQIDKPQIIKTATENQVEGEKKKNFETIVSQNCIPKPAPQNRQLKSHSQRNFIKNISSREQSEVQGQVQLTKLNLIKDYPNATHNHRIIRQRNQQSIKTSLYSQNNLNTKQQRIFQYHQIIPNFNNLFPHSPNLITDLRVIESLLSDHLKKNVTKTSRNDEYLKMRQSQLSISTIVECEKARKYSYLFDLELDSFVTRSHKLIQRIKNDFNAPNECETLLYRVVRQKEDVYDIINNCFHRTHHWFELPHGMDLKISWNLMWTWSKPQLQLQHLCLFQKINHFFGNKQLARKDLLKKNIEKIKRLGSRAKKVFDIIPQTFYLPGQNMQFIRKFREYGCKGDPNYWILKPVGLSRGRGIELVNKIEQIVFDEPIVLQKYVLNPLLLEGYKFDIRIYVLVTSINPLEVYVYREGFARISTQKYSLNENELTNKLIHLTNYSIQKDNLQSNGNPQQNFDKEVGGCKITLKMLRQRLETAVRGSWETVDLQIHEIVIKSLVSVMNCIPTNPNCFELFGYDIMIDENLKCWLIEVNSSPSLERDFMIDEIVKQQLVDDVIEIVDPVPYDRARLLEVVSRRRKELEGYKSHINTGNNSTQQLNEDLDYILRGRPLAKLGQHKSHKNFVRVAPSEMYSGILKLVQSYKIGSVERVC